MPSAATPSAAPTPTPLVVTNPDGPANIDLESTQLISKARALPDFAGLWAATNQTDLHVAVVGDVQQAADKLRPFVSADMTLFVHPAEYTYDELRKTANQVTDDAQLLASDGIQISFVSVDERANRVTVGVDPVDDSTTARF